MPAKINIQVVAKLRGALPKLREDFSEAVAPDIKEAIVDNLVKRGVSPVKGKGRFQGYSASYVEQMGAVKSVTTNKAGVKKAKLTQVSANRKVRGTDNGLYTKKPGKVNLTVSGTMLDSFKVRKVKGKLKIWFASKFAKYHNDGIPTKTGIVRRALFPKEGEDFSSTLERWLVKKASSVVDKRLRTK